ncbi:ATP4A [Symbiodinium sp. CCMP2456]|nr:ATP4A [Symbiodinium sp. CCMP2456]
MRSDAFALLLSAQSAFGGKYFIHWTAEPDSEEFFKFDVVDRDNYNEVPTKDSVVLDAHARRDKSATELLSKLQAARSGQILIDSDISEPEEGIEVYVYKNAEARAELGKAILIQDLVIVPKELQDAIRVIQATPFPPYVGGPDRYEGMKMIIE